MHIFRSFENDYSRTFTSENNHASKIVVESAENARLTKIPIRTVQYNMAKIHEHRIGNATKERRLEPNGVLQ